MGKSLPDCPAQRFLVRFKLGLPGCNTVRNHSRIDFIKGKLSLFLRPVFPVCYAVLTAVQEVDLVKSLPVAHLHDFGFEMAQGGVRTAVLAALPCVGRSLHVGQERDFGNPHGVDNDMHMNVSAAVMPVRVGAYNGLVSGEMFPAKFLA